jgi:hypothetical protein
VHSCHFSTRKELFLMAREPLTLCQIDQILTATSTPVRRDNPDVVMRGTSDDLDWVFGHVSLAEFNRRLDLENASRHPDVHVTAARIEHVHIRFDRHRPDCNAPQALAGDCGCDWERATYGYDFFLHVVPEGTAESVPATQALVGYRADLVPAAGGS